MSKDITECSFQEFFNFLVRGRLFATLLASADFSVLELRMCDYEEILVNIMTNTTMH